MARQSYKNHIRFYPAHHFIFYPLIMLLFAAAVMGYRRRLSAEWLWIAVAVITFLIGWLSFMMRQHYALICQNRIVRLEMRLRYYILTQENFQPTEAKLSFGQLAALRFAADEELLALIKRALQEKLSPDLIKKSIKHWIPDEMRV